MSIVKVDSDRNQMNNILAYKNIPIIQQVVVVVPIIVVFTTSDNFMVATWVI